MYTHRRHSELLYFSIPAVENLSTSRRGEDEGDGKKKRGRRRWPLKKLSEPPLRSLSVLRRRKGTAGRQHCPVSELPPSPRPPVVPPKELQMAKEEGAVFLLFAGLEKHAAGRGAVDRGRKGRLEESGGVPRSGETNDFPRRPERTCLRNGDLSHTSQNKGQNLRIFRRTGGKETSHPRH